MSSSAARRARQTKSKSLLGLYASFSAESRLRIDELATQNGLTRVRTIEIVTEVLAKTMPGNICCGCYQAIPTMPAGLWRIDEKPGFVLGSLCGPCADRMQTDEVFAHKVDHEGFRALYGAGPDDVVGHA
jgi:hypothetical protein